MDLHELISSAIQNGLGNIIALFMVYYVVKDNTRREKDTREENFRIREDQKKEHLSREERLAKLIDMYMTNFSSNQMENRARLNSLTDKNDEAHKRQREELNAIMANQKACMEQHSKIVESLNLVTEKLKDIKCEKGG